MTEIPEEVRTDEKKPMDDQLSAENTAIDREGNAIILPGEENHDEVLPHAKFPRPMNIHR